MSATTGKVSPSNEVSPDGSVWYVLQTTSYDYSDPENYVWEEHSLLRKVTQTGETAVELDMDQFKENPDDYFYAGGIAADADGYIYVNAAGNTKLVTDVFPAKQLFPKPTIV